MALDMLFPKSAKRKQESKYNTILYITCVEWGWTYDKFINTPIPIVLRILKEHNRIEREKARKMKKNG